MGFTETELCAISIGMREWIADMKKVPIDLSYAIGIAEKVAEKADEMIKEGKQ